MGLEEMKKSRTVSAVKKILAEIKTETSVPMYRFVLSDEKVGLFDSKVGGLGYVPRDGEIPCNSKGEQLRLLAQINCAEVDLPEYPEKGLLQFWIADNDLCGMNFDDNTEQDGFRVIYYADVDKTVTADEVAEKTKPSGEEDFFPVNGEFKIELEKSTDDMPYGICGDFYPFNDIFCAKYNKAFPKEPIENMDNDLPIDMDELDETDEYYENTMGHKIGGYAGFTQWDPRDEGDSHDFLLFQLDSDYNDGKDMVMWGDSGICGFFINSEKLKKLDFSDIIYNWDCC